MLMIVCADDVGLTKDIDRVVLELAAMGRLSAASCMVAGPRPPFADLRAHEARLDIGLHITLTDAHPVAASRDVPSLVGRDGRMPSFGTLLRRSLAGGIDAADVTREVAAQHARFEEWAGRPPDFLDSHCHVHQFPCVRAGLIGFVRGLPASMSPYVRNAHLSFTRTRAQGVSVLKCLAIGFLGGLLRRQLLAHDIPTNRGFAGIYDYRRCDDFPRFLRRFTATMTDRSGIIMTHPGQAERWRQAEYEGLHHAEYLNAMVNRFPRNG